MTKPLFYFADLWRKGPHTRRQKRFFSHNLKYILWQIVFKKLIYNDGVLILSLETDSKFLGNVGLDIPVYLMSKDRC